MLSSLNRTNDKWYCLDFFTDTDKTIVEKFLSCKYSHQCKGFSYYLQQDLS